MERILRETNRGTIILISYDNYSICIYHKRNFMIRSLSYFDQIITKKVRHSVCVCICV